MYRIMIALSFVLGIAVAAIALKKKKVPGNIMFYSVVLELMLTLYMALMATYILSGAKNYGLNSTGGAFGMIAGAFIFSKITPKYREAFFSAYILVLPLMYGLGKIGCAFAGCCAGIHYDGLFHISSANGNVFPIQALEAAVFLILFTISFVIYLKDYFDPCVAAIVYSMAKIFLDFLRATHESYIITSNQIMCLCIALVFIVIKIKKNGSAI